MLAPTANLDEAGATPGHANRTVRLKYVAVAEMLDEYLDSNNRIGRLVCPVCDYLKAHLDDDVIAVERFIYAHPDWGPVVLCDTIRATRRYNNAASGPFGDQIAAAVQHDAALALVEHHPFERARTAFCEMLKHYETRFVSPEAAFVCLAYLTAGHPNPRRFLEKPEVRAKFPADLDVSSFPAPDFEAV